MTAAWRAPRLWTSLQWRFLLASVVCSALLAALAAVAAYEIGRQQTLDHSRSTLTALVRSVAKTLAVGAYARDELLTREVLDGLSADGLVGEALVEWTGGTVIRPTEPARDPASAKDSGAEQIVIVWPLASPFANEQDVGVLTLRSNNEHVTALAEAKADALATLMACQVAVIALLLFVGVSLFISRPIVSTSHKLRQIAPGSDERLTKPHWHRGDEIGMLIDGANALLDSSAAALMAERTLRLEVQAMEAQYRQIFDSSGAGIFVLDAQGRLINGNPTVSRIVGLSVQELRELSQHEFVRRVFADPSQVESLIDAASNSGETQSADLEIIRLGEQPRWVHCLISVQQGDDDAEGPKAGSGGLVEGVVYDITERKRNENAVRHQSEHDGLTGLKNRPSTDAMLERALAQAEANGNSVSLLCIDLDGFKQVNDQYGHAAGDEVLVHCAARLVGAVQRGSDLVGRVGGDEFVVVLHDVGPNHPVLSNTARAIVDALCAPIALSGGHTVHIGASIGMACFPRHAKDRGTLYVAADVAMYEVKRSGKNSYALALEAGTSMAPPDASKRVALPAPAADASKSGAPAEPLDWVTFDSV